MCQDPHSPTCSWSFQGLHLPVDLRMPQATLRLQALVNKADRRRLSKATHGKYSNSSGFCAFSLPQEPKRHQACARASAVGTRRASLGPLQSASSQGAFLLGCHLAARCPGPCGSLVSRGGLGVLPRIGQRRAFFLQVM